MYDLFVAVVIKIYNLTAGLPLLKAVNESAAATSGEISYFTNTGIIIQLMLISLILFSVVCWTIIIFKVVMIKRAKRETKLFLDIFWTSKSLDEIFNSSEDLTASPLAGIFRSGFVELDKIQKSKDRRRRRKKKDSNLTHITTELDGIDNISRSLKNAQNTECVYLERYIPFLATTGSTTPFIGLFGTVWGLMVSFQQIGLKGSSNLAVVAPGIAGALVTTAAGLAAAIPAVLAYNYFINEVSLLETEMENFSFEFLNIIDRHLFANPDGK